MITPFFKKGICVSLSAHAAVFLILGFSFGQKMPYMDYADVSFWGGVLKSYDLSPVNNFVRTGAKKTALPVPSETFNALRAEQQGFGVSPGAPKPAVSLAFSREKAAFPERFSEPQLPRKREKSVVMFYPALPYNFSLYFRDRQVAHVELEYNIISSGRDNSITIRRKTSSGNLEADLLCMRYINHYLSVQQSRLAADNWKTVKIDLQAQRDGKY